MMTAGVRKVSLTAHIGTSVGWFGAVAAFLALAVAGVMTRSAVTMQGAYVAMHLVTWAVIVPFGVVSFASGVVQSVGTPWGLFRHYWVVTKLVLTLLATVVLLVHTRPIDEVAALAAAGGLSGSELWRLRLQLVGDASAALFVLGATTALSVYKPWGLTPIGIRAQPTSVHSKARTRAGVSGSQVLIGIGIVLALIALLHLFGIGMHH